MAKNENAAKTPDTKATKPNIFTKIIAWFKNLGLRIFRAFKNMLAELKKVTWPTRKELINVSLLVLAFMAVMGVIIGVLDAGAGALMKLIVG
ncbi:MAG: preprotein translocase subunit SecE [Eubacteriales bacterium]|nr:preprotein translocase subunit SecE [Eubacteriales bacterium]